MKGMLLLFFICITIINCGEVRTKSLPFSNPVQLNDGINTSEPSAAGLDDAVITDLYHKLSADSFPNIHSVLIYKNDQLVFEQYFRGKDERWGDDLGIIEHRQDDLHDVRSVSKSIVSACIGIAITQRTIKSAAQRVFDFFPEHNIHDTGWKKDLTIEHLLTMTSGLEWNENIPYTDPRNSEIQMDNSPDPIEFVLSRRLISRPGSNWNYNGGTTELLAAILEKASGMKVDEFAQRFLFRPIGITTFEWVKVPGSPNPAAASGLRLRSRDLLKFAILYHQKGHWNNEQIIPAGWIDKSLRSHIERPGGGGYGYQFWILNDTIHQKPIVWPTAVGNGDQRIFIDDTNQLLVVVTAGNYNLWNIRNGSSAILKRIYDSFKWK
jgi:CubicO group peptidase (beta-lactamase class C family)